VTFQNIWQPTWPILRETVSSRLSSRLHYILYCLLWQLYTKSIYSLMSLSHIIYQFIIRYNDRKLLFLLRYLLPSCLHLSNWFSSDIAGGLQQFQLAWNPSKGKHKQRCLQHCTLCTVYSYCRPPYIRFTVEWVDKQRGQRPSIEVRSSATRPRRHRSSCSAAVTSQIKLLTRADQQPPL